MNALDKNRKKCTSWCEDCDKVFDNLMDTDIHRDVKKHKVKVIEFWTISRK
ncbi:MAG: hypothetical protein ACE5SW_04880 [Nitrososphaeraceae archaeon]